MAVDYAKGEIVLVNFSFGLHPGFVVYDNGDDDVVILVITSRGRGDPEEVEIPQGEGNIARTSYVRTHKIATVSKSVVSNRKIGSVSPEFLEKVRKVIFAWL